VYLVNTHLATKDVNKGQKILIRLRPAWAPDTFYDEEDIIGTMLHEVRSIYLPIYSYSTLTPNPAVDPQRPWPTRRRFLQIPLLT
jgi:hypothetical protein